jgi:hypothetical protein
MYTSTFVFKAGAFDDAFHRLDEAIAAAARSIPGYLGETSWRTPSLARSPTCITGTASKPPALVDHPLHREAKARQANWLDGSVTISQVLRTYGDGKLGPIPGAAPEAAQS